MLGLGYYIVPRVSNGPLANIKWAWYALHCINLSITLGSITLMMGINNGGGEYREYIWPIMLIFGIGLALTLSNYFITVARRKTTEIYISNWYIVSALSFFYDSWTSWLLATVAEWTRRNHCSRLLYASSGGYVVYVIYTWYCLLLFASATK